MQSARRGPRPSPPAVALIAGCCLLAAAATVPVRAPAADGDSAVCARLLGESDAGRTAASAIASAWIELMRTNPGEATETFLEQGSRLDDPAARARRWLAFREEDRTRRELPAPLNDALAQLGAYSEVTAESLGFPPEDWNNALGILLADRLGAEAGLPAGLAAALAEIRSEIPVQLIRKPGPLGRRPRGVPLPKGRSIHVDFRSKRVLVFDARGEILHSHELPASLARPNEVAPIDWTALRMRDGGMLLFFTRRECALLIRPTGELEGRICDARITQPHHAIELSDGRVAVWDTERDELLVIDPDRIGGTGTAVAAHASTSGFHAGVTGGLFRLIARPDGSAWLGRIDGEILALAPDGSSRRLPPVPVPHQNWPVGLGGWSKIGIEALPSGRVAWVTPANVLLVLSPEGTPLWSRPFRHLLRSLQELSDGSLILGDESSVIERVTPLGARLWFKQLPNTRPAAAPALLPDGRIVVSVPDDFPNASSLWILDPSKGTPIGDPVPLGLPGARSPLLLKNGDLLMITDADSALSPGSILVLSGADPRRVVFGPIELTASQTASALALDDGRVLVSSNGELLWIDPRAAAQFTH